MKYSASFEKFPLIFKKPAGTSRGFLLEKPSWLLKIKDNDQNIEGIGECSIIPGLSIDDEALIEEQLREVCNSINKTQSFDELYPGLEKFPAIKFALETAILDLKGGGKKILFDNSFSRGEAGIMINGLVWMSGIEEMFWQAKEKIEKGFKTIKFKIGAMDFESELNLIRRVRNEFGPDIEIRLDANGAFNNEEALSKLEQLSAFQIHSIEQPIKPGHWQVMGKICATSPIPIALDEELIGITGPAQKSELLQEIKPQYIILKPSLLGGFKESDEWINLIGNIPTEWWATSALESNIGLNAIAQWTAEKKPHLPQGLGTGDLYMNNFPLPLKTIREKLWFLV